MGGYVEVDGQFFEGIIAVEEGPVFFHELV